MWPAIQNPLSAQCHPENRRNIISVTALNCLCIDITPIENSGRRLASSGERARAWDGGRGFRYVSARTGRCRVSRASTDGGTGQHTWAAGRSIPTMPSTDGPGLARRPSPGRRRLRPRVDRASILPPVRGDERIAGIRTGAFVPHRNRAARCRRSPARQRSDYALTDRISGAKVGPVVRYADDDAAAGARRDHRPLRDDHGPGLAWSAVAAVSCPPVGRLAARSSPCRDPLFPGADRPARRGPATAAAGRRRRPTRPYPGPARPSPAWSTRGPPHRFNRCFVNDFCTCRRRSKASTARARASPASQRSLRSMPRGRISVDASV